MSIEPKTKLYRRYLWLILALIILFAVYFLVKPLRINSAYKFISSGDRFLVQKKYLSADLEYRKALLINPNDKTAKDRIKLTDSASEDINNLSNFFSEKGLNKDRELLEIVNSIPTKETQGLEQSRALIERGEYQLAIIPAKIATEMDPEYRDAWVYLGIANLKTAQLVELKPEFKEKYLSDSKMAFGKAKEIDPEYSTTDN